MPDNNLKKPPEERRKETFFRELSIESSIDAEARTVELSFSSDAPYKRFDWWNNRYYEEILSHEDGAVDLERLSQIGVVLVNHDSRRLPVGAVEKAWLDGNKGRALVRFDDDEESEAVFKKVQKGIMRGVSVGYKVDEWQITQPTDGRLAVEKATRWEPLEISIVSVPADASVGVGRSFFEQDENTEGGTQMPEMVQEVKQELDTELIRSEGSRAERERVREILEMGEKHGINVIGHIDSGASVEQVRKEILDELAARPKVAVASVEVDEQDKFRAGILEGTAFRAGLKDAKPNEFSGMSFSMLADRCLARAGDTRRDNSLQWVGRAFLSTSDFPYVCGEIANKSVLEGWNEAPETWREWCGVGSAPDFRTMTMIGLGAFGNLPELKEGEEYKYAQRVEEAQTVKIVTFGKMFALTRQAIINDDLGMFTDTMRELGSAARRTIAALPYAVLTANAALADNVTLFHTATHKNTGTAGAISVDTLDEAELKMSQHKDAGSKKRLGISPKFLLAPMALKGHVRQFFATQLIGGVENQPNIYNSWFQGGGLTAIYEFLLDDDDTAQWYLAADKGRTVKVYFLNGVQSPYLEMRDGWNVDGTEWKVRIDAAAAAVDYRGLFRNAGQ
jgi:HK97 family phage prohead protease